jgi:hypothetical protein
LFGLARPLERWLAEPRPELLELGAITGVASIASSALNNLPATLLVLSAAARRGVDLPPLEVVKVA